MVPCQHSYSCTPKLLKTHAQDFMRMDPTVTLTHIMPNTAGWHQTSQEHEVGAEALFEMLHLWQRDLPHPPFDFVLWLLWTWIQAPGRQELSSFLIIFSHRTPSCMPNREEWRDVSNSGCSRVLIPQVGAPGWCRPNINRFQLPEVNISGLDHLVWIITPTHHGKCIPHPWKFNPRIFTRGPKCSHPGCNWCGLPKPHPTTTWRICLFFLTAGNWAGKPKGAPATPHPSCCTRDYPWCKTCP